jgi:hypothetical protein
MANNTRVTERFRIAPLIRSAHKRAGMEEIDCEGAPLRGSREKIEAWRRESALV